MTDVALSVELFIDGAWVDISSYVRGLNGREAVTIEWGSTTRGTQYRPTRATFQLNDPDAVFNDENPYSAYYGLIGDNILGRVLVDGSDIRCFGEFARRTPSWKQAGGRDAVVDCEIVGQSRRLESGEKPLKSAASRALRTASSQADTLVYWALEDEKLVDTPATEIALTTPMVVAGTVNFGSYTNHPATARMPTLGTSGQLIFALPPHTSTAYKVVALWNIPSTVASDTLMYRFFFTGGVVGRLDVMVNDHTSPTEGIVLLPYSPTGVLLDGWSLDATGSLWGEDVTISIELEQVGADVEVTILIVSQTVELLSATHPWLAMTLGTMIVGVVAPTDMSGCSVGQLIIGNDVGAFADFISPSISDTLGTRAFNGDRAGRRVQRLCTENDITFEALESGLDMDESQQVGPQEVKTFRELIEDANNVDGGLIGDSRDDLAIFWRGRRSLYNQAPAFTLTYAAPTAHLSDKMNPAGGDLIGITNDVTASRSKGSSARYAITTDDGYHKTIDAPPVGVGDYDTAPTFAAFEDSQLNDLAAWSAHLGSWKERLYDKVTVDLTRSVFTDTAEGIALALQIRAAFAGDLIEIDTTGSSRWLPSDRLELLAIGGTEVIAQKNHTIAFSTVPARPYEVWQMETGGSVAAKAQTTSGTAWRVATTLGPAWSTTTPYRVQAGGEAVQVDVVSTETITFGALGTVATGNGGASVAPGLPAGVAAGDAMILFAAIRSSGTGTPNTPTGWTQLTASGNMAVYGRYYVTGDAAPTVSFTGGAAGDDTYARIASAPGASISHAGGTKGTPAGAAQLNGAATNIAYPALTIPRAGAIVWYFGWRQDDATSVATLAGATEDIDTALTTGNDMHVVVDHVIQTTAADIAAGSFVVTTGGGTAISRAIVLALRPLQAMTVQRAQNGVSVSITSGSAVKGWRMGVVGL